jgi:ATP-dependent Clp protease ATP-binding subunit ClpA
MTMFERFTHPARQVVVLAQAEARRLDHTRIGTEHLLLGLLVEGHGIAARALANLGLQEEATRHAIVEAVDAASPTEPDPKALKAIGIDLDAVRRKVEETFGPGALDRVSCRKAGRRGSRISHIPLTSGAKKALELTLREALRLGDRHLDTEHILLGLLREGDGIAAQLLRRAGIDLPIAQAKVLALRYQADAS